MGCDSESERDAFRQACEWGIEPILDDITFKPVLKKKKGASVVKAKFVSGTNLRVKEAQDE